MRHVARVHQTVRSVYYYFDWPVVGVYAVAGLIALTWLYFGWAVIRWAL